tara:strand:+ start:2096 stop:2344 length:249 start_codon:yes stop_codon:yes gene_type:complete
VGFIRSFFLLVWLAACFILLLGILQLAHFSFTGEFIMVQPQSGVEFLERWAVLGFLLDALVVGLIYRWFVRRKARRKEQFSS